jgi:ribosomally synthesized peptide (two-chain TOMM family)
MSMKPEQLYESESGEAAPFPRLRAAYLRFIALVWRLEREPGGEAFLHQLVHPGCDPRGVVSLLKGDPRGVVSLLKGDPRSVLPSLEGDPSPRGVLPLLEVLYNFKFPYNVEFAVRFNPRPKWRPNEMLGWYGGGDEFLIYLPLKPSTDDLRELGEKCDFGLDATLADALALYCERFPSLLGKATDGKSLAPEDFANFGVMTSRLLAMTWYDQEFANDLFQDDDARDRVQKSLNIVIPWNFRLKFLPRPWPQFMSKASPYNKIAVYIPQRPDDDEENDWAIALARYNDTGPQYPFTCP